MPQTGTCTLTGLSQPMQAMFTPAPHQLELDTACTLSAMVSNEPERGVQMTTNTGTIVTFHMPSQSASEQSAVITYPSLIVATPREPGVPSIYAISAEHASIRQSVEYFETLCADDNRAPSCENNACTTVNASPSTARPAPPVRTLPCDPINTDQPHPLITILQKSLHVHACTMHSGSLSIEIIAHACAHSPPLSHALLDTINTLQSSIAGYQSEPALTQLVSSAFPELCVGWNKLTFTVWNSTRTPAVPSGACMHRRTRRMQREYTALYAELFNGAIPDLLCLPVASDLSGDDDDDMWGHYRDRTFSTGSGTYDVLSIGNYVTSPEDNDLEQSDDDDAAYFDAAATPGGASSLDHQSSIEQYTHRVST